MKNIDIKNIPGENPKADVETMSNLLKRGFSIILILILFLAVLNIFQLQKTRQQLNNIVSVNIQKMALGSIMRDSIRLRTISLYKMLETHDDYFQRDEELIRFYNSAKHYRLARDKTNALGVTKIEKKLNDDILIQIRIAQPITRDAAESMLSNSTHDQLQQKVNKAIKSQDKLYQLLNQLNTLQENQSNQALEDANKNLIYTIILTLVVAIIVIYLSIKIATKLFHHVITTSKILAQKNVDLEKAYIKADESTKIKSEFLTKMSHELRTPMNGVMGMIQLLQTTELNDEQKDYTETALNSSQSLMAIIDNILDFSKIESGGMDVEETPFNLTSMIDDVITSFKKSSQEKNIKLSSSITQDINKQYMGDPVRISQALMNMVDNAVKFTKKGEVKLNVSVESKTDTSTLIRFEVHDTGIGIPDELKEKLFTAFNQADNSIARNYDGTGLGLSISQKLISLMDGEVGIKDAEGGGSIFWFTLKLEQVD